MEFSMPLKRWTTATILIEAWKKMRTRVCECSQRIAECSLSSVRKWKTWAGEERHSRVHEECASFWFPQTHRFSWDAVDEAEKSRVKCPMELKMQLSWQFLHFTPTFYCNLISLNVELLFKCLIFSNLAERAERQKWKRIPFQKSWFKNTIRDGGSTAL